MPWLLAATPCYENDERPLDCKEACTVTPVVSCDAGDCRHFGVCTSSTSESTWSNLTASPISAGIVDVEDSDISTTTTKFYRIIIE